MNRPTSDSLKRYGFLLGFFILALVALAVRFFVLQIPMHDYYEQQAVKQQTSDIIVPAKRGTITDRNGVVLAVSSSAYLVSVSPAKIAKTEDKEALAQGLSEILDLDYETVLKKISKNVSYVEIARGIEKEQMDVVAEFIKTKKIYTESVNITEISKRYYPKGNLLSTVLGFVGTDNVGLEGVEYYYNSYLSGSNGKIITSENALGTSMPFQYEKYIPAEDGYDIALTVDIEMQYFLEKHIENARVEHNVQSRVAGVIMDVKTGEVLAMSSKPDYDPNSPFTINDALTLENLSQYLDDYDEYVKMYNQKLAEFRTNKLVVDQYDPGSTFKIFTSAMLLEENLVSPTETFYCKGSIQKGAITYKCAKRSGHGLQTFKEGLAHSCNPVFVTLAERIGIERFYNYITVFGLREKTGVGLPGEKSGIHHALSSMTSYNLYSSSFGQTFKITGMQLVAGVSAVANGGSYMQPSIISRITDSDGNIIESFTPTEVRRTVSKRTAETLWDYLEYTVQVGKTGYASGYRIAGKTGTSQKAENGNYENEKRIASFICFAPADDPQICVLVIVDEPDSQVQYGSYIAAPLGRDIIVDCLKHLNIEPDYGNETGSDVKLTKLVGKSVAEAKKELSGLGLNVKIVGDYSSDTLITYQIPAKGETLPADSMVLLYTTEEQENTTTSVPNLIGKTAAECNQLLAEAGLNIRVVGESIGFSSTVAVSQSVSAGTTVEKMTVITVKFES